MSRRSFLLAALALAFVSFSSLQIQWSDLLPSQGGRTIAAEFFAAAIHPATDFESVATRKLGTSFADKVASAVWITLRYAVMAMTVALVIGVIGGVLASRAWWQKSGTLLRRFRATLRLCLTAMRSVHELLWALLLLTAMGASPWAAIWALALPYGGTLAKVFAEMLDETSDSASSLLRANGGSGMAAFTLGIVSRALPDLASYAVYRLECAFRSSAVLGFVGIPTLGYEISTAFEDGHFGEVWTYLYAIIGISIAFEWWGAQLRRTLSVGPTPSQQTKPTDDIDVLWTKRATSPLLRTSALMLSALTLYCWFAPERWGTQLSAAQRYDNFVRFTQELIPYPVRETQSWGELVPWLNDLLAWDGMRALWGTFHLGTLAALLAGALSLVCVTGAARTLQRNTPRDIPIGQHCSGALRNAAATLLRAVATVCRAIPEFILAFISLQIFGPTVWALIVALALHNAGVLVRLGAEVIDNLEAGADQAWLSQGGSTLATYWLALLPTAFNRFVLLLLYRWETCIREATVLGMLSFGSLGFLISEARVRLFYDEMLLWVLVGGGLVFAGDVASDAVRKRLRAGQTKSSDKVLVEVHRDNRIGSQL
ncbi:MAG: ABC transporter permease subunit [Pseudomonadota bacterium]